MSLRDLIVLLIVINGWALLLYLLVRTGWLQRLNMALFGPALMIKTQRGRGLLDWLARARGFFDGFASLGIYLTFVVMFLMSLLLVAQLFFIFRLPPEAAPSPSLILGIPGVNPIIPLGYGIIALIFAVVVHELAHGVLARVHKIPVRTMGVLLLIIPIGAFVEPDEEEMRRTTRRKRIKVFGAGPMTNLAFALLFALVFSPVVMGQARPIEGASIGGVEVTEGRPNPACSAGLLPGWTVTAIARPNATAPDPVRSDVDFSRILNGTAPGTTLLFYVHSTKDPGGSASRTCYHAENAANGVFPVTPVACHQQYDEELCRRVVTHPDPLNRTVVGVSLVRLGSFSIADVHGMLVNPLRSVGATVLYMSLPFLALSGSFPLAGVYQDFFEVPGDPGVFWFTANLLYWLFWINLMLGLTNALPIVPLDGGHMFRDLVGGWLEKRRPQVPPAQRDATVRRISLFVTLFLLTLVLMQFIGPRLAGLFV